jgi:FixJ family two-component response regulator
MGMPTDVHIHDNDPEVVDYVSEILNRSEFRPVFHRETFDAGSSGASIKFLCRMIHDKVLDGSSDSCSAEEISNILNYYSVKRSELVIFYSRHVRMPNIVHAIKAGANDFIEYPFDPVRFMATLQGVKLARLCQVSRLLEASTVSSKLTRLTLRESSILQHIIMGKQNKTIAHELSLSQRTVENHRASLMHKMEAKCIADLMNMINKIKKI